MPNEPLQEVLGVSVDTTEFAAGLAQLKSLWDSFVSQIGSENIDKVVGSGAFGGILTGFNELKEAITQISAEAYQSIESLTGSVTSALGRIEQAERDAAETAARSKTGGKGGYDDQAEASKFASEQDALRLKRVRPGEEYDRDATAAAAQQAKLAANETNAAYKEADAERLAQAKVTNEQLTALDHYEAEQAKAVAVQIEAAWRQKEAVAASALKLTEASVERQSAAEVRAYEQTTAAARKAAEEKTALAEKEIVTSIEASEKMARAAQTAAEERAAAAEKAILEEIVAVEKLNQAYQEAYEKQAVAATNAAEKAARLTEESAVKQAKRTKENSFLGGLSGEDGIGAQIGRVARFAVEWQLVGAAINGVMAVIGAPFKVVSDGVKYLQELEATAAQISGVLLENVKYSEDLTENFKQAQLASTAVVQSLQEMAVRDKIKPDVLQNTFQNVLEAGAGRGTKNTEDVLKVTELLATSFKTLGINARSSRTEIENALNGTPASGSKFLELMKMTSAEWVKQRDLAYENGTLVDTLASHLEPFVDASKRAGETQGNLLETVKLLGTRLEATFATPLFNEFTEILKAVAAWLERNKDNAEGLAKAFGSLVAQMLAVSTEGTGLKTFAKVMIELFSDLTAEIAGSIETLKALPVLMKAIAEAPINPVKSALDAKGAVDDYARNMSEISRKNKMVSDALWNPGSTQSHTATSLDQLQNDPLLTPTTPGKPPPDTTKKHAPPSELPDDMVKFQNELKQIKAATKGKLDDEKEAVASRTKSQEQSTHDTLSLLKQEDVAVQALVEHYRALVGAAKDASTPAGKQRIATDRDRLTGIGEASTDSLNNAGRASTLEDIKTNQQAKDAANKESLSGIEKSLRDELAAKQAAHKEENISEAQLLDAEMAAQSKAHTARQTIYTLELVQAGQNQQQLATVNEKIKQDDSAYTADVLRLTGLRIDIIDKEKEARAAHSVALSKLREESNTASDTADASFIGAKGNLAKFDNTSTQIQKARDLAAASALTKDSLQGAAKAVQNLEVELGKLSLDRLNNLNAQLEAIKKSQTTPLTQQRLTTAAVQNAVTGAGSDLHQATNRVDAARANGASPDKLKELTDQAEAAAEALKKIAGVAQDDPGSKAGKTSSKVDKGIDAVLGPDFKEQWDAASGAMDKTTLAITGLGNIASSVQSVLGDMAKGRKSGGTIGGIGAGLSNKAVDGGLDAIAPGLGQVASAVGSVMSLIGSSLMAETIRIANGIKDAISATTTAYQTQSANLSSTIAAMQQERANAIASLSGQKGGYDQLKAILSSLDPELTSLKDQASQMITAFANSFNQAQMQVSGTTDALSTVYQQWVSINQQVIDYINAGGDAAVATQYLSDQLQLMQQAAQNTLNQGQQQAVQDAINLNGLLLERTLLVQSLNEQAFALQNQDAEERTEAGVITRAEQLKQQQIASQQQLNDLNYQIATAQETVTAESQVFTIAANIADLHRQDDQLTLEALDLQLDKYTALQQLVASITQGANGLFSSTEGFLQPTANNLGPTITLNGGINVTVVAADGTDPAAVGKAVADSVSAELATAARMSPSV